MNKLKRWMQGATPAEQRRLARLAGTSLGTLQQIAGGYRTKGKLSTTPELARRIELAAFKLRPEHLGTGAVVALRREDLCRACRHCDLAKKARRA
jgi:hypothetical protein